MRTALKIIFLLCLIAISAGIAPAQVPLTTGTPPFSSFAGGPIDVVNEGNTNVHLSVPLWQKAGRGIPIDVALTFDSAIWTATTPGLSGTWSLRGAYPDPYFGGLTWYLQPLGYYKGSGTVLYYCYTNQIITGWVTQVYYTWYDQSGTPHSFPNDVNVIGGTCGSGGGSAGTATDGSGYSLVAASSGAPTITDKHGRQFAITSESGTSVQGYETDTNGNQISWNGTALTDTLGKAALTMAGGSGLPPTPITLTYTSPNGQPAAYTMKLSEYTIRTNFGCANVTEFGTGSPYETYIINEIDLPDQATNPSDKYTFTYESTPGYPADTTGRLASVTLPTGGTIYYTYPGANDGINCYDGTSAELTRTTPDGASTYGHSIPTGSKTSTTTATDPLGNQTVVTFERIPASSAFYSADGLEIQRSVYTGAQTTLLGTTYTCYNGSAVPCTITLSGAPFVITQTSVFTEWPSGPESETNTMFDSSDSGLLTHDLVIEKDEYDYGNGAVGSLLRKTLTSYASLSNNILDRPAQVSVYDGSSNLKAQTTYTYDGSTQVSSGITTQHIAISGSRGNPTKVTRLISGSSTASQNYTYFDTGVVDVAYDPNTNPTTYGYSSTYAGAYATTVKNAKNQTTTNTYDINTGLLLSTIDPNNLTTSYTYDSLLRPLTDTYPNGGQTTYTYPTTTEETVSQKIDSLGHSRTGSLLLDSLGRKIQQIVSNGETVAYDQTDTCYDADGRTVFTSYPYQGSGLSASPCPSTKSGDSLTLDSLGRTTKVTHSDGSVATTNYANFPCVIYTDEQSKTKQDCSDGLARITSVIEDPGTSPHLNLTTAYTYDALDDLTGVTQAGSRQRTFVYDSISRLTSSTNPESNWSPAPPGTYVATAYTYDANGNLTYKAEPTPNQQGTGTTTLTYCYDALNRVPPQLELENGVLPLR